MCLNMSFTDDDKDALGEDLDELKSNLAKIENRVSGIQRDLKTLVRMAWGYIILSVIAGVIIGVGLVSANG